MDSKRRPSGFPVLATAFTAIALVFGLVLTQVPLLRTAGYETGLAVSFFIAIAASITGVAAGRRSRIAHSDFSVWKSVNVAYASVLFSSAVFLLIPVACVSIHTVFFQHCRLGAHAGLPLVLWITVPTMLHYGAVGLAAGRLLKSKTSVVAALLAYFAFTSLFSLALFITAPTGVVPNLTIGMASLSGYYGFDLVVPSWFNASRALVAVMPLFFLGTAALAGTQPEHGIDPDSRYFAVRAVAVSTLIFIACLALFPDQTGLGSGRRTRRHLLSAQRSTDHAMLHFEPGSISDDVISRTAAFTEWNLMEIGEAVPFKLTRKIDVFIYKDSDQMSDMTGARNFYYSAPWLGQIHIEADAVDSPIYKHELVHLAMAPNSSSLAGVPLNIGIVEGAAVAIENHYYADPDFQRKFAAALKSDLLKNAHQSFSTTGFGSTNAWKSYEMAGGFTGYLIHKYGGRKFAQFYSDPDTEKTYGKSLAELNAQWTDWLKGIPVPPEMINQAKIKFSDKSNPVFFKTKCPRVGGGESDPLSGYFPVSSTGQLEKLERICDSLFSKDKDPKWLRKKADADFEASKFGQAESTARRILSLKNADPLTRDDALRILSGCHYSKHSLKEIRDDILNRKALGAASPEEIDMLLKAVNRQEVLGPRYLGDAFLLGRGNKIAALSATVERFPDFAPAYLMLAKLEAQDPARHDLGFPDRAARLINEYIVLSPADDPLAAPALSFSADLFFDNGQYSQARIQYERAIILEKSKSRLFILKQKIRRVFFFRKHQK